jgi:hypothetical protein
MLRFLPLFQAPPVGEARWVASRRVPTPRGTQTPPVFHPEDHTWHTNGEILPKYASFPSLTFSPASPFPDARNLQIEERNLLSVGYKNVIGARRASWRILSSIEDKERMKSNEANSGQIKVYRAKVGGCTTWNAVDPKL